MLLKRRLCFPPQRPATLVNPGGLTESNMTKYYLFTSESVSEGHPDKLADQISDSILDWMLERDPAAKVACETLIAHNTLVVAGEFKSAIPSLFEELEREIPEIAQGVLRGAGYQGSEDGFDPDGCEIHLAINAQSADISQGVEREDGEIGAGDQGLMFGYATNETPELAPLPITLAHRLVAKQAELRRLRVLDWLRPDAKSQVAVRYEGNRPCCVEKVLLSTQHGRKISNDEIRREVIRYIIEPVIPEDLRSPTIEYFVNPTGRFEVGGPTADTGLTGRKIIVDTYGGACPHGGGAFSGKDPTKVDRSGAYIARYIAKNIVAAGISTRCSVQIAYAIGIAEPFSVHIDLHGTGAIDPQILEKTVREVFPLTPRGIIETLKLRRPIYRKTAVYGHFGRSLPEFTWERVDRTQPLLKAIDRYHTRDVIPYAGSSHR
jgi:S-adenosylmethionine synthetase